jgi:hypothetical protein
MVQSRSRVGNESLLELLKFLLASTRQSNGSSFTVRKVLALNTNSNTSKILLITLVACGVSATLLFFAYKMYPPPMTDSIGFVPAAIALRNGYGLVNPIYSASHVDTTGAHRFIYYPPGFPLIISALSVSPSTKSAFLAIAFLRTLSLGLSAFVFYRAAGQNGKLTWPGTALVCLGLLALSTNWTAAEGRPEVIGSLSLLGAMLTFLSQRGLLRDLLVAAALAIMSISHPVGAILSLLLLCMFYASSMVWRDALKSLFVIGLAAAILCACLLALSPNGLANTLIGTLHRSRESLPAGRGTYYDWKPWMFSGHTTFSGVTILLAFITSVSMVFRYRKHIGSWSLLLGACGAFIWVSYVLVLRVPNRAYNLLLFNPLLFAIIIYGTCSLTTQSRLRGIGSLCCAVAFGLVGSGFIRYVVQYPVVRRHGLSYDAARVQVEHILKKYPEKICMSDYLWTLSEEYSRMCDASDIGRLKATLKTVGRPMFIVPVDNVELAALLREEGYSAHPIAESDPAIVVSKTWLTPWWIHNYSFVLYRP